MGTIAFLGYGRFGSALGALFREAGEEVLALDPGASIPAEERAASLADFSRAAFVVVAVPIPAMGEAFAALRPHLGPGQIVFDVGSVKISPAAVMAATLGREIPWVATHPLFGPVSLLRGDRPLRAVVCPSALHPEAAAAVRALYARIGCQVLEQDADTHDRAMAWTHALAFFVAKGMIDAGAPAHLVYAPPSFQGLARTIDAARSDAGHLFAALHRENPYAGEARHALLESLAAIDRSLVDPAQTVASAAALAIPDLGAHSPDLTEARELIDEVDREILELLGRRALLARRAGAAKAGLGAAVRDPRREAALLEARRREASLLGLDAGAIADVFEAILRFSRKIQQG
jgi:prephenate dehydrogenase